MARGDLPLIATYYLLKYWKVWVVLIPAALVGLGYFVGAS
jgi:hypothetical protein